jgi:hypothetical protein
MAQRESIPRVGTARAIGAQRAPAIRLLREADRHRPPADGLHVPEPGRRGQRESGYPCSSSGIKHTNRSTSSPVLVNWCSSMGGTKTV